MIEAKNSKTGYRDKIADWCSKKQTIKLQSGITVIDSQRNWQYYNPNHEQWLYCFKKR